MQTTFRSETQNRSSDSLQSFESVLSEKLNQISEDKNDLSEIRYSVTKSNSSYSGVLLINSSEGNYFATASSKDTASVNKLLALQIASQIRIFKKGLKSQLFAI